MYFGVVYGELELRKRLFNHFDPCELQRLGHKQETIFFFHEAI